mmetsp:Transcript_9072/g.16432  ORF Transcript_9072/g.16432 Transcript_9072/m.16432 type:complete len:93 (-) Transcript_9072:209-487(-)
MWCNELGGKQRGVQVRVKDSFDQPVDKKADPSVIQSANYQTQQDKQDSTGQCHFTYTIIAFLNVSTLLLLLLFLCFAHDALTQYSQLSFHLI